MPGIKTLTRHPGAALVAGIVASAPKFFSWQSFSGGAIALYVALSMAFFMERAKQIAPRPRSIVAAYVLALIAYGFVPYVEAFRVLGQPRPHGWAFGAWFVFALLAWAPILVLAPFASRLPPARRLVPVAFAALGTLDVLWLIASI